MGITCKGIGKMRGIMQKLENAEAERKERIKNAKSKSRSQKKETN